MTGLLQQYQHLLEQLVASPGEPLAKLDLLILDELGYVPASKLGSELLFDVISQAYERTSIIVTTNLPFEQWTEVLDNERLTGAALDRLTPRGEKLHRSPGWRRTSVASIPTC